MVTITKTPLAGVYELGAATGCPPAPWYFCQDCPSIVSYDSLTETYTLLLDTAEETYLSAGQIPAGWNATYPPNDHMLIRLRIPAGSAPGDLTFVLTEATDPVGAPCTFGSDVLKRWDIAGLPADEWLNMYVPILWGYNDNTHLNVLRGLADSADTVEVQLPYEDTPLLHQFMVGVWQVNDFDTNLSCQFYHPLVFAGGQEQFDSSEWVIKVGLTTESGILITGEDPYSDEISITIPSAPLPNMTEAPVTVSIRYDGSVGDIKRKFGPNTPILPFHWRGPVMGNHAAVPNTFHWIDCHWNSKVAGYNYMIAYINTMGDDEFGTGQALLLDAPDPTVPLAGFSSTNGNITRILPLVCSLRDPFSHSNNYSKVRAWALIIFLDTLIYPNDTIQLSYDATVGNLQFDTTDPVASCNLSVTLGVIP